MNPDHTPAFYDGPLYWPTLVLLLAVAAVAAILVIT
jgi:hypothetical protein